MELNQEENSNEEKVIAKSRKDNGNFSKWFIFALVFLTAAIFIKYGFSVFENTERDEMLQKGGFVENHIYKIFLMFDRNKDGLLEPLEFQSAYYDIQAKKNERLADGDLAFENTTPVNEDLKSLLENQTISGDEEVLTIQTFLKPFQLTTMKKFIDNPEYLEDDTIKYHLHGLRSWVQPHVSTANFSVSKFSIFLPPTNVDIKVNITWEIIPKVLGSGGEHLRQERYYPPKFANEKEELLYHLTSMFHPRPFLHMRFPPRGAVACIRALNDDYYDVMFRFHPEFQMNEPPRFPFWFTVAAMVGKIVIKKDGSHVQHFEMHVPTKKQLNVDMEWMTADRTGQTEGEAPEGMTGQTEGEAPEETTGPGQEVDIGYIDEMRLESTTPSFTKTSHDITDNKSIQWQDEIDYEVGFSILEKEFYPFKEVTYFPFNETMDIATSEGKLIHHIVLWGSLDDQSC